MHTVANHPRDTSHGHGTFCAAVAAGQRYGVAKKANVIGIKALNDVGTGKISSVLQALDWVVGQHKKSEGKDTTIVKYVLIIYLIAPSDCIADDPHDAVYR